MSSLLDTTYDSTQTYEIVFNVNALDGFSFGIANLDEYGYISGFNRASGNSKPAGPNWISTYSSSPSNSYAAGNNTTGVVLSSIVYYHSADVSSAGMVYGYDYSTSDYREIFYATNLGIEKDPWVRDGTLWIAPNEWKSYYSISYDSVEKTRLLNYWRRYSTYNATEGNPLSDTISTSLSNMVSSVLESTVTYETTKGYKKTKRMRTKNENLTAMSATTGPWEDDTQSVEAITTTTTTTTSPTTSGGY